jgi:CreA protein
MVELAWLRWSSLALAIVWTGSSFSTARADDVRIDLKKSTVWRALSPNAKLATYVIDDPGIEGVACYFTVPEVGGWKGWAGFAEEKSDVSLPAGRRVRW